MTGTVSVIRVVSNLSTWFATTQRSWTSMAEVSGKRLAVWPSAELYPLCWSECTQSCTGWCPAKRHLASLSPTDEAPADLERLIRVRQYFYAEHLVDLVAFLRAEVVEGLGYYACVVFH